MGGRPTDFSTVANCPRKRQFELTGKGQGCPACDFSPWPFSRPRPSALAEQPGTRADYRAAFDDGDSAVEQAAWPADESGQTAAGQTAAGRPAQLPLRFQEGPRIYRDGQVAPALATQAAAPSRLSPPAGAIPLSPPRADAEQGRFRLPTASLQTVAGGLGAAVGLFLIVAWVMRRGMPKGSGALPREVVEPLGRLPLGGRHQLHLLRLGNKLLLVSISQGGIEALGEVTDPAEVDRLTALCYQNQPQGSSAEFRRVLKSFEDPRSSYGSTRIVDRIDLSQLDAIAQGNRGKEGAHAR